MCCIGTYYGLSLPQSFAANDAGWHLWSSCCIGMYDGLSLPQSFAANDADWHLCVTLAHKLLATIVEGNPKAPFSIATTPRCRGGRYSFPGLLYFTLDPYLIMLSVKQGGIKYHFLSLWYDSTWNWTQVSRAIGEHSNR